MEREDLEREAEKVYTECIETLNEAFGTIGVLENEYLKAIKKSDKELQEWIQQRREGTEALKKGLRRIHK